MTTTNMKIFALIGLICVTVAPLLAQSWSLQRDLVPSGVRGQHFLRMCGYDPFGGGEFCVTRVSPSYIQVQDSKGRHVTMIRTGERGRFWTQLPPGKYTLIPVVGFALDAGIMRVVVRPGEFVPVTLTSRAHIQTSGFSLVNIGPGLPPFPPYSGQRPPPPTPTMPGTSSSGSVSMRESFGGTRPVSDLIALQLRQLLDSFRLSLTNAPPFVPPPTRDPFVEGGAARRVAAPVE